MSVLFWAFLAAATAVAADRVCPPLLSNVSKDALTVSVVMDSEASDLVLTYGEGQAVKPWKVEKTDSKQLGPEVVIYKFRVTDLKAGESYPYEVAGFKSSFRAAPDKMDVEVLFVFGGDYNMPDDNDIARLEKEKGKAVDFFVDLGDHLTNRRIWRENVTWVGRVPIVLARGNHDNDPKYTKDKTQIQKYLDFPGPKMDFTHEWGPAMVRAEDVPGYSKGYPDSDLEAIEKAFAETKCPWKFYAAHHVFFSDGPHGHQEFDVKGKMLKEGVLRRQQAWPIFQKHNLKLVLNGHDHLYQRSLAIDKEGKPAENGIVNVTFGGSNKTFKGKSDWSAVQYLDGKAALAYVHIQGETAVARLVEKDGKMADEVQVKLK